MPSEVGMMAIRPGSLPKSPESNGLNGLTDTTNYESRKPRSRGSSPAEKGYKKTSVVRNGADSRRTQGSTPSEKFSGTTTLPQSRDSDNGIVDRLDEGSQPPVRNHVLSPEDNINVVVRVRPLNNKEVKNGDESVVQYPGNGQILLGPVGAGHPKPRVFSYNVVFEPGATQEDVVQFSGIKRLIEMAVEGFSTTAFCYGQTGSGKTHTLTGPPGLFEKNPDPYSEDHGLVFRSFMYLFELLKQRSEFHFILKASFLEIYNEKVIDLLNPGTARKPLAVRWSKKSRGFFVENLFTVDCEELDDLLAVLEEGMRNRSVGRHNMNDYSSRSHTILTVHITSEQQMGEDGVFISKQGKINFVDLAGSEMTKKTHSEGKTLEEANNINKSLMVLGYCIASLSDSRKKGGHIPYRDSKLTKLLADSLAGNGVTLMIACISPARSNVSETINTLRYAARAKKIRTKPIVVMDPREALILSLKREVNALQSENDHLRSAINFAQDKPPGTASSDPGANSFMQGRLVLKTPPTVDLEKLAEMEGQELSELVRHYMTENEALRKENAELFTTRELVLRDQELVCRENERLLKKLEDVNSVCCRSPIIPARPTYSAEMLNMSGNADLDATNVWVNPLNASLTNTLGGSTNSTLPGPRFKQDILEGRKSAKPPHRLPESIQKELEKRSIGNSMMNIAESYREKSHRRHNSWDNGKGMHGSTGSADSNSSARRNKLKELADNPNQDGNSRVPQRTSSTPIGSVTTESPLPEVSLQRRPASISRTTGADTHGVITSSVLPDRKMFSGQAIHNAVPSGVNHSSPSRLALKMPVNYSSVFESFDSNISLPDNEGPALSQDHEETGDRSSPTASSSGVTNGIRSDSKRHIVQSLSADSALLPIRSGPFPDNEIPDSSPGSLHHSPLLTRKRDSTDQLKPANPLGTQSPIHQTDRPKKDPFGSLVSLHDGSE